MAKKTKTELELINLIADIMTRNVNLSKEEYAEKLKKMGFDVKELEKTTDEERLARIRMNFYGSMINMFFATYQQANDLMEELDSLRASLRAICEKLGIDYDSCKTTQDKLNEATEKFLKKKTNFK